MFLESHSFKLILKNNKILLAFLLHFKESFSNKEYGQVEMFSQN
jgi:hypothetical protein